MASPAILPSQISTSYHFDFRRPRLIRTDAGEQSRNVLPPNDGSASFSSETISCSRGGSSSQMHRLGDKHESTIASLLDTMHDPFTDQRCDGEEEVAWTTPFEVDENLHTERVDEVTRHHVYECQCEEEVDGARTTLSLVEENHTEVVDEETIHDEVHEHQCEDEVDGAQANKSELVEPNHAEIEKNHKDVDHEGDDEVHPHHIFHKGFKKLIQKLKQQLLDIRCDVDDGFTEIIQIFAARMPNLKQHHSASKRDGFGVNLLSLYDNGGPIRLGAHLLRTEKGYKLTRVFPDSVAHKVGLKECDILTRLNDVELEKVDDVGVLQLFMDVEKTFTLTILREVGEGGDVRLVEIPLHVNISIKVVKTTFVVEVKVFASRPFPVPECFPPSYITQNPDGKGQIYLNALPDDTVTMGTRSDDTAIFQLDLYFDIPSMPEGQLCVIRNVSTDKVYNVVDRKMQDQDDMSESEFDSCYLIKHSTNIQDSFHFESVKRPGEYLENADLLELIPHKSDEVPSTAIFRIYEV